MLIIVGENADDFDELRAELMDEHDPQSALECELVERLAGILWRLRRVPFFEAAILDSRHYDAGKWSMHDVRYAQSRGFGLKVSDEFTVPLCATHHHHIHTTGRNGSGGRNAISTHSKLLVAFGSRAANGIPLAKLTYRNLRRTELTGVRRALKGATTAPNRSRYLPALPIQSITATANYRRRGPCRNTHWKGVLLSGFFTRTAE